MKKPYTEEPLTVATYQNPFQSYVKDILGNADRVQDLSQSRTGPNYTRVFFFIYGYLFKKKNQTHS